MVKVLLIDDDQELLDILGEWLSSRGHEIRSVSDPNEANQAVASFAPDLVILDGLFRGTTGQEIATEIEAGTKTRIIYLSGLPREELPPDRVVLQKPIDLEVLDQIIRLVVANEDVPAADLEAKPQA